MCDKRTFKSKHAAREANKHLGKSVRAYWHVECVGWHVTSSRYPYKLKRRMVYYTD